MTLRHPDGAAATGPKHANSGVCTTGGDKLPVGREGEAVPPFADVPTQLLSVAGGDAPRGGIPP